MKNRYIFSALPGSCNAALLLALFAGLLFSFSSLRAQTFPAGFSQVKVGTIYYPTSMAFAPDGRIFVTEKAGKVKIIKNGAVLSTPFLTVNVDQLNERGLSSIGIDPNFNTNHYVYIYYTVPGNPVHNRLSRVTANGDVMLAGSEVQILNFEPCVNSIHNSGGMAFGPDGKLYIGVGNDNVNSNSQDLSNYLGKVLRINSDGSVPAGNPFSGSESAKRIWAYGFRNPWSLAIQPGTGKIFVNDVGEGAWEEINDATTGGKNFGWPGSEGMTSNPNYTNPVYTYHHGATGSNDGCAITGGTFFNPATTNYPAQYTGKYFFIDYCNDWINYIDVATAQKSNFATGLGGGGNYIKVGPDGNLYYFSISQNSLYKIIYSNTNAPAITSQPANQTVPQGQSASFTVSASGATPLTYQWQKNGVNISGANSATYTINNAQQANAGQYKCVVSNAYGNASSNSATLTVTAFNAQPVGTILTPASGTIYRGGDVISFSGSATDQEDGTLPASAFQWIIDFHHDQHIHPGPTIQPGSKTGSFPISTTGEMSANVYFRLKLIVTDSQGLTDTSYVDIHPKTSTLTLNSQPSGLQLFLDGQPHTTPFSILEVSGMVRNIGANASQSMNGGTYNFDHWVHGGGATQNFTVTDNNQSFTAVYTVSTPPPPSNCSATGSISREVWSNVPGASVSNIPLTTAPTSTSSLTIFEEPSNSADNYGSRIRGYICPPTTGSYKFWIASDDNSELWLSTDAQPANKTKIASVTGYTGSREWTKYISQQSVSINLNAGQKYYIESLHKEGDRGDNLAVGWQLPNGTMERPIPGTRLSPFTSNPPAVTITSPANNTNFPSPANITINATANVNGRGISKVEFYQGNTKIGEDNTSPYSITWMNVTTGNYAIKAVATDNSGQVGFSSVINIVVTSCSTPVITPSGPTTMCSGSVVLNATSGSGYVYQWKKDGNDISGATAAAYTANATGDYQVKVIHGSCISWSAPTHVSIQNSLSATITAGGPTTFCNGGNVKLYANTCSGYTYQWKKNGNNIAGANASVYTATTGGTYQLQITQNGANAWSALVDVTVNACEAEKNEASDSTQQLPVAETAKLSADSSSATPSFQMKVFPNPTTGLFTISFNMGTIAQEKVSLSMLNMLGQQVYSKQFSGSGAIRETVELDQSLPTGIYTLQVLVGNKMENTSVFLSH